MKTNDTEKFRLDKGICDLYLSKKHDALVKMKDVERMRKENLAISLPYNFENLPISIEWFIEMELKQLNERLYKCFSGTVVNKKYSRPTLNRIFGGEDAYTNPFQEQIDLLCYFMFGEGYEDAINDVTICLPNHLEQYKKLKTYKETKNRISMYMNEDEAKEKRVIQALKTAVKDAKHDNFVFEACTWNEIKVLKDYDIFGSYVELDWEKIRKRLIKNPDFFKALKVKKERKKIIVGFCLIYPVSKNLVSLMHNGDVNSAEEFEIDDICSNFQQSEAVYISALYGFIHNSLLLKKVIRQIVFYVTTYPHLSGLYAKPRTPEGQRLADQFFFEKLEKSEKIFFFSRQDIDLLGEH